MNEMFKKELDDFLKSECDDYGISYEYSEEDEEIFGGFCYLGVEISRYDNEAYASFRYDMESGKLGIDMYDDNWENIARYDSSVRYFWIYAAPALFPER